MRTKISSFFPALLLLLILTACGGGSDSAPVGSTAGTTSYATTGITGGIAVDPYIVKATFFEDVNGNGRWDEGEQISTFSDEQGRFSFTTPVPAGRTIIMLDRGYHQGLPFAGQLMRRVEEGDSGNVVVTPMTTLAALGFSDNELASVLTVLNTYRTDYDLNADPMSAASGISAGAAADDPAIAALRANLYLGAVLEVFALDRGNEELSAAGLRDLLNWTPLVDLMNGLRTGVAADTFNYINLPAGYTALPPVTMREVVEAMPAILSWWKNEIVRRVIADKGATLASWEFIDKLDAVQEELTLKYYVRNNQHNEAVLAAIADEVLPSIPASHVALTKNGTVGTIEQLRQEFLVGQRLVVGNGSRLRFLGNGSDNQGTTELTYRNSLGQSATVSGRWWLEENILILKESDSDHFCLRMELQSDWNSHLALRIVDQVRTDYGSTSFIGRLLAESGQFRVAES